MKRFIKFLYCACVFKIKLSVSKLGYITINIHNFIQIGSFDWVFPNMIYLNQNYPKLDQLNKAFKVFQYK